ncbi:CEAM1 protein, partial [Amia calva]|nr:CEAM1 protein [Amia calva]
MTVVGGNLTLQCQADAPVESRQWSRVGQPLPPHATLSTDNSTLSLTLLSPSDTGDYECRATNPVGTGTGTYSLTVYYGPDNAVITGPDTVNISDSVILHCSAQSMPPATFTWTLSGTIVSTSTQYTIHSASSADQGNYTCMGHNQNTNSTVSVVHELSVIGEREGECDGV